MCQWSPNFNNNTNLSVTLDTYLLLGHLALETTCIWLLILLKSLHYSHAQTLLTSFMNDTTHFFKVM